MSNIWRPCIALLSLLVVAAPATAQDASTYQLPPASTATPAAQGPVVPDAPPPRSAVTPTPTPVSPPAPPPAPVPAPTSTVTLAPPPAPVAEPERAVPAPRPNPSLTAVPETTATPTVAAPAPAQGALFSTDSAPDAAAPSAPPPVADTDAAPSSASAMLAAGLLAGLALLAAVGAMLILRRKTQALPDAPFERPVVPLPAQSGTPEPALAPVPGDSAQLAMTLESLRMSASLVNATLAYRLSLTALTDTGPAEVRLQMTSAHASRLPEEQFGTDEGPVNHRLAGLQAGQSAVLEGEIRLPLAAITPIRHGNSALFVPLVRIDANAVTNDASLRLRRAFVVGIDDGAPGTRLQPFRLDLGPRVYPRIGQRELTVPAFS